MTRRGRAIHRADTTAKALVSAAKQLGAHVHPLDGAIDALVFYKNRVHLVDWKTPGATLTESQAKLVAAGWPLRFISTVEQLTALLSE